MTRAGRTRFAIRVVRYEFYTDPAGHMTWATEAAAQAALATATRQGQHAEIIHAPRARGVHYLDEPVSGARQP